MAGSMSDFQVGQATGTSFMIGEESQLRESSIIAAPLIGRQLGSSEVLLRV